MKEYEIWFLGLDVDVGEREAQIKKSKFWEAVRNFEKKQL